MVRFDTFLTSVRDGSILNENNFGLLVYSQEGLCGLASCTPHVGDQIVGTIRLW